MYNHVTGPKDKPKFAIKITNPKMTKKLLAECEEFWIRNPIETIVKEMADVSVPAWRIVFLPTRAKSMLESKPAITLYRFNITGMILDIEGKISATISTP